MAGTGTISVNQQPQYGDKTAIDRLKKATTTTPMTGNETPARKAGRPATGRSPQAKPASGGQPVDQEHAGMMTELANAFRTNQYWQGVLQQYPSDWSRTYAKEAARVYAQAKAKLRTATPFFE